MVDHIDKRMMEKDALANFIWKLYTAKKPNIKTASMQEVLVWILKYYGSREFIKLHSEYHGLLARATKYFPFSLGWQDRAFHYKNRGVIKFVRELESVVKGSGYDILIMGDNDLGGFYEVYGSFREKIKEVEKVNSIIQDALMKKYDTIYVRGDGEQIRIIIPSEMFEELTKV